MTTLDALTVVSTWPRRSDDERRVAAAQLAWMVETLEQEGHMGGQHSTKVAVKGATPVKAQKVARTLAEVFKADLESGLVPVVVVGPEPVVALVEAPVVQTLHRKLKFKRWVPKG